MADVRSALASKLSLSRWFRRSLSNYIVWDPATLLVPAKPAINRPAEQLVYSERRHLVQLFITAWPSMLVSLFGPLLLLGIGNTAAQIVIAVVVLAAEANLLWNVVEWAITRIMITDRRVIEFGGFLRRNGGSMPLSKLTDLAYEQTFPGLLFDYGMVRVESAGQDQALSRIRYLRYPVTFQQELVARAIK